MDSIACPLQPAQLANILQLHAHLTGSISRECLHDIWVLKKAQGPTLDLEDPLIAIPNGKVDYNINT
jgi:adenosine deaminase